MYEHINKRFKSIRGIIEDDAGFPKMAEQWLLIVARNGPGQCSVSVLGNVKHCLEH